VQWGEQTKDEMGAVNLQVYPTAEADLVKLRDTYQGHVREVARDRIRIDPTILSKVREIMGN
jgi:hypothetical protein